MENPTAILTDDCRKKKKKTTSIEDAAILITKSVQDVIECSKDDNFKRRCLKAINVDDFEELERKTNRKLKKLLKTRCGYSRKREGQENVAANENCESIINKNQLENSQSNYTPIRKRNRSEPLQQFSKNKLSSPRIILDNSLNVKQQNTLTTHSNNLIAIETQQTITQTIRSGNEKKITDGNDKSKVAKTPEKTSVNITRVCDIKTLDIHTTDLSNHTQQKVDLSLLCDFINGANDELTEWLSPNTKYRSPSKTIYPQSRYNMESLNSTPLHKGNSENLYENDEGETHETYIQLQKDESLVNSEVNSLEDSISIFPNSFVNTNLDISSCFKKTNTINAIKNDVKLPLSVSNYSKDSNFSLKNDIILPLSVSDCNTNNNYNMQNNISECRDLNHELLNENITDCSDVTQTFYTDTIQSIFDKDGVVMVNNKLKEIFEANHIVPDIDNNIEDWLGEFENDEFWCQTNDRATNENDVFGLPTEELFSVDNTTFHP